MFRFKKQSGSYTIQSVHSNLWLDIKTPIKNNSNVKLWGDCNSLENHWVLENAGDGYVYMRSNADYYLDVQGDQAKDRANIQVYHFAGNNSQRWKLVKVEFKVTFDANGGENPPDPQTKEYGQTLALSSARPKRDGYDFQGWATSATATSADYRPGDSYTQDANITFYAVWRKLPDPVRVVPGVYVIHSAMNDDYCLDITKDSMENNANIQLYHVEDSPVQKFAIVDGTEGYSYIQSQYNGRWLDVKTPIEDRSNVKLYDTNTDDENSWRFEDAGDGFVWIRNKTGYYLDVNGDSAVNNANVQIYHYTGMNSQKWRLENVTPYTVTVIDDGCGTGTASSESGIPGTEVTLTASPAEGYRFKEWQVVSGGVEITENKFTIGVADVQIKAIFEAIPAPKTIAATVTGFTGMYDGQAHGITVSVTDPANGATVMYGRTADNYEQTTSPMITNVADSPMTVFYQVKAEGYSPMTGSAVVTISKADLTVAAPKPVENLFYTGSAFDLITAGSVENDFGTLYYAATNDQNEPAADRYTTSIPTATDAGTYYVWYKAVGDANHNDLAPACVQVVISGADKSALNALIASAEEYCNGIANYPDIAAKLKAAIDAAKAVARNDNAAEGDVAGAISALNGAVDAARADVQAAEEEAKKQAEEEAAKKMAADETAAQAVLDAIKALPDKAGTGDGEAVAAARAAYEALTDDQKQLVSEDVLKKLTTAEAQVQAAEEEEDQIKISACKITVKDVTYTGKAVTAKAMKEAVTVKYNDKKLKYGTDYALSYDKKLKAIGPGKVTVVGKGKYTGSKKVSFSIVPKGTAFTKLTGGKQQMTLNWKNPKNINGYQIEYSLKKDFSGSGKVKIGKAKTLTTTIKKLKGNKNYYVRIRTYTTVKKKNYFSAWSKAKTVKTKGGKAKNASAEQVVNAAMNVGEALSLKPLIPSDVSEHGLTWDVDDATVATVSREGVVTALQPGEAVVTMTNADGDRVVFVVTISAGDIILLEDEPLTLPDIEEIGETEVEMELELEVELPEE